MPKPLDLPDEDDDRPRKRREEDEPPLSRTAYILLGIFLGWLGVHNLYAGYYARGAVQFCASMSAGFSYVVLRVVSEAEIAAIKAGEKGSNTPIFIGCGMMAFATLFVVVFIIRDLILTKKDARGRWLR